MKFVTQYEPHERIHANIGDPVKVLYSPRFAKDGTMELVESGRENLYEFIQSHAEGVDIHVILERFARGDISALSRAQGAYGDFTTVPKTYAEMLNTLIAGEEYFNSLPVEVRAKFDHSFQKFVASMDAEDFWSRFDLPGAPSPATPSETVQQPSVPSQVPPVAPVPSESEVK
uniref:Internal scaffolding protein n=1 Tax=Dulem virus 174 TaxID=3145651 RepID=A0AAU8B1P4_9VIRU